MALYEILYMNDTFVGIGDNSNRRVFSDSGTISQESPHFIKNPCINSVFHEMHFKFEFLEEHCSSQ